MLNIVTNGNIAPQQVAGAGGAGNMGWTIGLSLSVLTAATLGSLLVTIRWTDPHVGAQSVQIPILLTILNNHKDISQYCFIVDPSYITVEAATVGLLGTTSYALDVTAAQGF